MIELHDLNPTVGAFSGKPYKLLRFSVREDVTDQLLPKEGGAT